MIPRRYLQNDNIELFKCGIEAGYYNRYEEDYGLIHGKE
jgi:hypothetical protein